MDRSLNMEPISFEPSFNVSPLIASYLQPQAILHQMKLGEYELFDLPSQAFFGLV